MTGKLGFHIHMALGSGMVIYPLNAVKCKMVRVKLKALKIILSLVSSQEKWSSIVEPKIKKIHLFHRC